MTDLDTDCQACGGTLLDLHGSRCPICTAPPTGNGVGPSPDSSGSATGSEAMPPIPPPPDDEPPLSEHRLDVATLHERDQAEQPTPDRAVPGGAFLLDQPAEVPSIWGEGTTVAWPQGEPFYLAGGIGTGKTTLGGQVALARAGIGTGNVLDLPVTDDDGRLLYLAMDRPNQIARALARLVTPDDRQRLDQRVTFWAGPPPFYLPDNPERLATFAAQHDATTVVVDSVKDLAGGIEKPEIGWAINAAFQACVVAGIEVGAWHHQRKATGDNRKPTRLADLYGSAWLGAGAGSVLLLWGDPGDAIVELTHLKPAADQIGPWTVVHDHDAGTSSLRDVADPLQVLTRAPKGITARSLATRITGKPDPRPADVERARRQLERLTTRGLAHKQDGDAGRGIAALYLPAAPEGLNDPAQDTLV